MSVCDIASHTAGWTWLWFCFWHRFLGPCCCSCFMSVWTTSSSAFSLGLCSRLSSLVQTSLGLNIQATVEFWVMDKKERSQFIHSAKTLVSTDWMTALLCYSWCLWQVSGSFSMTTAYAIISVCFPSVFVSQLYQIYQKISCPAYSTKYERSSSMRSPRH